MRKQRLKNLLILDAVVLETFSRRAAFSQAQPDLRRLNRLIDFVLLVFDEPHQVVDRIEVLRHELVVRDLDGKAFFKKRHQFQHTGRIDDALVEERILPVQTVCSLTEQEVVVNELTELMFNGLHGRLPWRLHGEFPSETRFPLIN